MQFSGFSLITVSFLAIATIVALIALHFLKSRHSNYVVPTILFWIGAEDKLSRRELFGGFNRLFSLLFLLVIAMFILFAMMRPELKEQNPAVLVIDTAVYTDHEQAIEYALDFAALHNIVCIINAGEDVELLRLFSEGNATSKNALNNLSFSDSPYSSINQALQWASALSSNITVITGQNAGIYNHNYPNVDFIYVPKEHNVAISPINVYVYKDFKELLYPYLAASNEFNYTQKQDDADIVIDYIPEDIANQWREPAFVGYITDLLRAKAGQENREHSLPASITEMSYPLDAGRVSFYKAMLVVIAVLMVIEMYAFRKGRIV